MGIISTIVIGFIIGLLARAVKPGDDAMGWIWTILLGIGGSFVGGQLAVLLGMGGGLLFTIIFGVIGAVILLFIYEIIRKKMK